MVISKKKEEILITITLNGQTLKRINKFKYLGSKITSDGKSSTDIESKIAEAKWGFIDMRANGLMLSRQ